MGSQSSSDSLEGKRLGAYQLDRHIGSGGMADVYLGRTKAGKKVAIKVLSPVLTRDPEGLVRFRREAEAAMRLEHPNIVKVLDMGSWHGHHYMVMEPLRGRAFVRMVRQGGSARKVTAALVQVAEGLAYAHQNGVIHRDIKPENVLLTRRGDAKVADFGLARISDASSLTADGALMGTAKYMSPEQAQGNRAEAPSDIYSLGVVIYEAISGDLPFKSETQHGFLLQHTISRPAKPDLRRGYCPALAKLSMRCLAKDPGDRPSMTDVIGTLRRAVAWRPLWRRIAIVGLLVGLLVIIGLLIVFPQSLSPIAEGWAGAEWVRTLQGALMQARSYIESIVGIDLPVSAPRFKD